jgi:4'-phosphopantetheinyl transferase
MLPFVGRRYLAARHALRCVLGAALDLPPARVAIEVDALGKPHVANGTLHFNASRSAHLALVAVSTRDPVGVDIELARGLDDADRLARTTLTESEQREWERGRDTRAFLGCWTRKEACLKALGVGLTVPPASVAAGFDTAERVVAVPLGDRRVPVHLCSIDCAEYLAAIALARERSPR